MYFFPEIALSKQPYESIIDEGDDDDVTDISMYSSLNSDTQDTFSSSHRSSIESNSLVDNNKEAMTIQDDQCNVQGRRAFS